MFGFSVTQGTQTCLERAFCTPAHLPLSIHLACSGKDLGVKENRVQIHFHVPCYWSGFLYKLLSRSESVSSLRKLKWSSLLCRCRRPWSDTMGKEWHGPARLSPVLSHSSPSFPTTSVPCSHQMPRPSPPPPHLPLPAACGFLRVLYKCILYHHVPSHQGWWHQSGVGARRTPHAGSSPSYLETQCQTRGLLRDHLA